MVIKHRLGVLFMSATLSVTVQPRAPGQCQNIMTSVQELLPHLLQQNNYMFYYMLQQNNYMKQKRFYVRDRAWFVRLYGEIIPEL